MSLEEIASSVNGDAGYDLWDSNPNFQRDFVWSKDKKRLVIDSITRKLPFGMITLVKYTDGGQTVLIVLDGKQRANAIASFMRDEFDDLKGRKFSEWTLDEQLSAKSYQVPIQTMRLQQGETWSDILELFRRINTTGQNLTDGQLLWSCHDQDTIKFLLGVFYKTTEDEQILALRNKWSECFCKGEYQIDGGGKSRNDMKFLAPIVISFLTGSNDAITTSFSLLNTNGLKEPVTEEMKQSFFTKMDLFLSIAQEGQRAKYFTKSIKGYPTSFSDISVMCFMVNIVSDTSPSPHPLKSICEALLEDKLKSFFITLQTTEIFEEWKLRLRSNRNNKNLTEDVRYINGDISARTPRGVESPTYSEEDDEEHEDTEMREIMHEREGKYVKVMLHEDSGDVYDMSNMMDPVGKVDDGVLSWF